MDKFLTLSVTGICAAGIFAIGASGLVLTYTTTGIFNFAHGAIGMLGAFLYWQLRSPLAWGLPAPLALFVVLVLAAPLLGVLLEVVIMRGLQGTSEVTKLVVSISLLVALLQLGLWIWPQDEAHPVDRFFEGKTISVFGSNVTWHEGIGLLLAVAVAIGLRLLLYRTRAGIAMRASVDDRPLAALNGARPARSALLALSHTVLTLLIVNAYAAAMIGRLRSIPLTFVGALILGLADAYATGYVPSDNEYFTEFRAAVPIVILFIVLLVLKPSSLTGHTSLRTREVMPRPTYRGALIAAAGVVAVTALVAGLVSDADAQTLGQLFGVALVAASLVPLIGYAGQISLCPLTFAGIGALAMGYHGGGGNPIGLVFAAVLAGEAGALVALPALRLRGIYLALATAAFAVIMDRWLFLIPDFDIGPWKVRLFGSSNLSVSDVNIPGIDTNSPKTLLIVLSVVFGLFWLGIVAIRRSRFGERLLAMKDSPAACATLGMNTTSTKLAVFALSAAMAGVGGAFYAAALGGVAASNFDFFSGLPLVLLVVVGGIGTAAGALFAGLVSVGVPLATAPLTALRGPLSLLPGLMGIGLGRNPNGASSDIAEAYQPLRHAPVLIGASLVAVAVLFGLHAADVISGWWFAIAAVVVVLAAPGVDRALAMRQADRGRAAAGPEVPLELVGIDRPFTAEDLSMLDNTLALPSVGTASRN